MSELILSYCLVKKDLPKLNKLITYPTVAMLYVTFNDVLQNSLSNLEYQTYPNYDVFILDDSTDERCKDIVDSSNFKVIRRNSRKGFKAGALNNWLSIYGYKYKYFVVSDSDSLFEKDFIENMVKYAENTINNRVVIFQSVIQNWNDNKGFPRTIAYMIPVYNYINAKLVNDCENIASWGHNNLYRTEKILELYGFDENFVAEDLAIGIKVINKGYECKLVDIVSYDMIPETIQSYSKRQVRWAKQNIELFRVNTNNMSFTARLHLFIFVYHYLIWFIYFFGIIMAIFGYNSSMEEISNFINFIIYGKLTQGLFSVKFLLLIFYISNFSILRLPLALKLGISFRNYFKNLILSISINYFIMIYLVKEQLRTILGNETIFEVTDKTQYKYPGYNILTDFKLTIAFLIFIYFGVFRNPLSLIYNFFWLLPLILSPFIIYLIQKDNYKIS